MDTGRDNGFTLVELMVTATILIVMVFVVTTLSLAGSEAQEYAGRLNRVTEINQDILDEMRLELVSSVTLFGGDAVGSAHFDRFDLSDTPAPLDTMRLPAIDTGGDFGKDPAGDENTGNVLFYARHAWTDEYRCVSGESYRVDLYRWIAYYPTVQDPGPRSGDPGGLGLVKVVSEPLVDGSQIDRIDDPVDRSELLLHLYHQTPDTAGETHPRVEVVWTRGGDPAAPGTFRQIDPAGGALSATPLSGRPDPWRVLQAPRLSRGDLLSYRRHSVATNHARRNLGVGRFGLVDNSGDGFPHGFEVQIVGPSPARQILLHLVLVGASRRGQLAWSDIQTVVDARDI